MMRKNKNAGFTLMELVLTIMVMSIISVSLSAFMSNSVKAYLVSMENARGVDEVSYVTNRFSLELRNVDHDGSNYQIVTADLTAAAADTRFEYDNTDGDRITLEYNAVSGLLTMTNDTVSGTAYTIADQVTAFDFNYYQQDGVTAASADGSDIKFVEFQISLQEGDVTYSSRTRVALRDLS